MARYDVPNINFIHHALRTRVPQAPQVGEAPQVRQAPVQSKSSNLIKTRNSRTSNTHNHFIWFLRRLSLVQSVATRRNVQK